MLGEKDLEQLIKFIEKAEMTTPSYDGLEDVLREIKERLQNMIDNLSLLKARFVVIRTVH